MDKFKTKSVVLAFFCASFFAVIIFLFVMWNVPDYLFLANQQFFSQKLQGKDKIFILGSSHVYALNPILIEDKLKKNGQEFTVYNLGGPGDDFEERERTILMIIEQKPKIVVYGIEPRAFETRGRSLISSPDQVLPNIPSVIEVFDLIEYEKKDILKNPKFALIRTISKPINNISELENPYPNTPFFTYDENMNKIINLEDLNKIERENISLIDPIDRNSNLFYLKKMIDRLRDNDIKVILFITPHSKIFLDEFPENQRTIFQSIMKDISDTKGLKVQSEINRYAKLNVWHDHTHLAVNNNTNFYSEDIANIILEEIKS